MNKTTPLVLLYLALVGITEVSKSLLQEPQLIFKSDLDSSLIYILK